MDETINLFSELNSYYRTQMNIMSKYLQIVWNRFNWFTTLNIALISYYVANTSTETIHSVLPKIGIALSISWLIIGLMDYVTIKKLNTKGKKIKNKIQETLGLTSDDVATDTGGIESMVEYIDDKVSQHFILYLFPSIILFAWIILYIF